MALRHVMFEDLGAFAPVLRDHGYDVSYVEAPCEDAPLPEAFETDLVVVLGGPVGAGLSQT